MEAADAAEAADGLESYSREQLLHLLRMHMRETDKVRDELGVSEKINKGLNTKLKQSRGQNQMLERKIHDFEMVKEEHQAQVKTLQQKAQDEIELRTITHYEIDRTRKENLLKEQEVKEIRRSAQVLQGILEKEKQEAQSETVGLRTALKVSSKIQASLDIQFDAYNKQIAELESKLLTTSRQLQMTQEASDSWQHKYSTVALKLEAAEKQLSSVTYGMHNSRMEKGRRKNKPKEMKRVPQQQYNSSRSAPQLVDIARERNLPRLKPKGASRKEPKLDLHGQRFSPSKVRQAAVSRPALFPPAEHAKYNWSDASRAQDGGSSFLPDPGAPAYTLANQSVDPIAYHVWHKKKALPASNMPLPALDSTGCHPLALFSNIYKGEDPMLI